MDVIVEKVYKVGMLPLHVTHVLDPMTPYIVSVIMLYTVDVNANSAVDVFGTHTHTNNSMPWNNDVGCHGV